MAGVSSMHIEHVSMHEVESIASSSGLIMLIGSKWSTDLILHLHTDLMNTEIFIESRSS